MQPYNPDIKSNVNNEGDDEIEGATSKPAIENGSAKNSADIANTNVGEEPAEESEPVEDIVDSASKKPPERDETVSEIIEAL